jgi:uncharacterized glyoxalase superfamily protein PhnB
MTSTFPSSTRRIGGASELYPPPIDQPYGYREYGATDSEGHVWAFM